MWNLFGGSENRRQFLSDSRLLFRVRAMCYFLFLQTALVLEPRPVFGGIEECSILCSTGVPSHPLGAGHNQNYAPKCASVPATTTKKKQPSDG